MEKNTDLDAVVPLLGEDWFDPLEAGVRQRIRSFIEAMLESELDAALNRGRDERAGPPQGHRHGHREGRCRAPGWARPMARPGNGGTGRCLPTSD